MIKESEPYLIEFNVRMGDPECQTILPTLKTDLMDIFISCCDGKLNKSKINFSKSKSICVVLCSKGYPEKFENNIQINDLDQLKLLETQKIVHAGTLKTKTGKVSNGGRVLNSTALSANLKEARDIALRNLDNLDWENKYYRRDIGFRAIDE